MPLKKKAKKKKIVKKVKAEGDDDEAQKYDDFPEYKDPDITTMRAKLTIRLASPPNPKLSKYKFINSKKIVTS